MSPLAPTRPAPPSPRRSSVLISRKEAAARLGISTRTLDERLIVPGKLPVVRLGTRRVLIRETEIDRMIEQGVTRHGRNGHAA